MVSSDEKTGIQALERKHRTLAPRPGHDEKIEFEYTRHGTLCLIANWDVAKGRIREARIGPTRTEADFVAHIETTVNTDPDAGWRLRRVFPDVQPLKQHRSCLGFSAIGKPKPIYSNSPLRFCTELSAC